MASQDILYENCRIATLSGAGAPYGLIESAAMVAGEGLIRRVGLRAQLPAE